MDKDYIVLTFIHSAMPGVPLIALIEYDRHDDNLYGFRALSIHRIGGEGDSQSFPELYHGYEIDTIVLIDHNSLSFTNIKQINEPLSQRYIKFLKLIGKI